MENSVFLYLAVGALAGLLSGLVGIGGGVVMVPALIILGGFSPLAASGTSLAVLLFPVGFLAVWQHYRDGNINLQATAIMALAFALSAWFGVYFAKKIPPHNLRMVFGFVFVAIGLYMAFYNPKR